MRQVALVAIDPIRNIVEILFLIWVQVLAPLKRVDGLKGFAKCDLITYRPRKINSAELRVGLRKDLEKRAISSPYDGSNRRAASIRWNISGPAKPWRVRELGVDAGLALAPFTP